ncbi:MAG: Rid family hydrolase [Dokdonella sp.]
MTLRAWISHLAPFEPATGDVVGAKIQGQTAHCLKNLRATLQAACSGPENALRAAFILGEEVDFADMNEEWANWLAMDPPACQSAKLPVRPKGMRVSIALVATV